MSSAADTFAEGLAGLPPKGVDPGELDVIAKQAVNLASGGTLEPAIVQAINGSDLKDQLSQEHVSRITEIANTLTHLGQLGGEMGYPTFNVADPSKVWLSLHPDGEDPTTTDGLLSDYSEPPSPEAVNGMATPGDAGVAPPPEMGAVPGGKIASVRRASASLDQVERLYIELRDLESLRDTQSKQAMAHLCRLARQEVLEGTDPSVMKTALVHAVQDQFMAQQVWGSLTSILGSEFPLVKRAQVMPDGYTAVADHPLTQAFSRALQTTKDWMVAKVAAAKAKPGYDKVQELRKQAILGGK